MAWGSISNLLHGFKHLCRQVNFTFSLFCISYLFLYPSLKCFYALKKVFIPAISVTAYCASVISCNLFLYPSLIVLFFFLFLYILLILLCQSFIFILPKSAFWSFSRRIFISFSFWCLLQFCWQYKRIFSCFTIFFIQPPNSLHIFILYLYCIIYNRIINDHSYHLANVPHCPLARRSEQWEF